MKLKEPQPDIAQSLVPRELDSELEGFYREDGLFLLRNFRVFCMCGKKEEKGYLVPGNMEGSRDY